MILLILAMVIIILTLVVLLNNKDFYVINTPDITNITNITNTKYVNVTIEDNIKKCIHLCWP